MQKVLAMIRFMTNKHWYESNKPENRFRKWVDSSIKDPLHYSTHPLRCHRRYLEVTPNPNEDEECGMLGHDLYEDTNTTRDEIRHLFGAEVDRIIDELTFPTSGPEWEGKPRVEKRKVEWEHLRKIRPATMRLKMIDRWDNLDGMANPNCPRRMIAKYIPETDTLLEICQSADYTIATYVRAELDKLKQYVAEVESTLRPKQ